jgi:hypothetical protein
MTVDRLSYIKQKLEEQKKSPAVILRHSDGVWTVTEIEQLRAENERLKDFKNKVVYADGYARNQKELDNMIGAIIKGAINSESTNQD